MTEMRILTVRQPWAWAIIHGGKDVENRLRNLAGDYRGPIAIHAGKSFDDEAEEANPETLLKVMSNWLDQHDPEGRHPFEWPWTLPGAIIGVVELADVHMATPDDLGNIRCQPASRAPGAWREACSPWAMEANYHLELADPRPLAEPIPYKGALGLRRLDQTTIDTITAALAAETGKGS